MVPSRIIANLLGKQINTLAIAREVYGYGTKPDHRESAGQANQHYIAIAREVYGDGTQANRHACY